MNIRYIDAHCHIQFEQYASDRDEVIRHMEEQGVAAVAVGCDLEGSRQAVALAGKHEHIFASIGQHPNHTDEPCDEAQFRALAQQPKVVAIGECGFDFFRPEDCGLEEIERQRELFKKHIAIAGELNKPLVIHARPSKGTYDAYHEVIALLQEAKQVYPNLRGDAHFFAGGIEEAKAFVALDFTLSFTAVITFARDYDEVIRTVPLTSLLAETDAPYVAPVSRRGKRNDPLAVIDVVEKIAELRGEDPEFVRTTLLANTKTLYSL
ncbi:MAG: TatD family hydrolase [Candidatus Kaiserbacteria bacterium]|nr:TatD family hydrolase [Candidatus Kaiserbacteria bacterium]